MNRHVANETQLVSPSNSFNISIVSQRPPASPPAPKRPPLAVSPPPPVAPSTMHPLYVLKNNFSALLKETLQYSSNHPLYVLPQDDTGAVDVDVVVTINGTTHFFERDASGFIVPIRVGKTLMTIASAVPMLLFTVRSPGSHLVLQSLASFLATRGQAINSKDAFVRLVNDRSDDVEIAAMTISLSCEFTKATMRVPLFLACCGRHIDAKTYVHLWFESEPVRPTCPFCAAEVDLNGVFFNRWLQHVIQAAPDHALLKISADGLQFVSDQHPNQPLVVVPEEVGIDC